MTEHLSMTGTDRAAVPHPAVPARAGRITRRVARSLNWGPAQVAARPRSSCGGARGGGRERTASASGLRRTGHEHDGDGSARQGAY